MKIIKILLLSFVFAFSFGCAPKENNYKNLNEKIGLFQLAFSFPTKEVKISDNSYYLVDEDFIRKEYEIWRSQLFEKGILRWESNFDCNKFSLSFISFLQERNMIFNYGRANVAESIAVGEVWYKRDNSTSGHAINVFLTKNDILFFDPQLGSFITLSNKEYTSIYLLKF